MPISEPGRQTTATKADIATSRTTFLSKARKRFKEVVDAESKIRVKMLDDLKFRASDQWPDQIRLQREADGRPCLTINRLPQFIHQITNQQRQNKPSAVVGPVDDAADVKTAEVFQGMIRHIEQRSQAQVAYNTAGEHQATIGRGFIRILTEYESDTDMNQSLVIKRVRNPFSIYPDPTCKELDYSDAMYWFVIVDLTDDQYTERFGDVEPYSQESFTSLGDDKTRWMDKDLIRVAEYWYVELIPDVLIQIETGDTILKSAVPSTQLQMQGETVVAIIDEQGRPVPVVNQRKTHRRSVKCATISGVAILAGNENRTAGADWPGKWIPIVPVIGDEIDINGEVDIRGIVRDAKDPQRRYNFQVSAQTEAAALAPKAPFVIADGQLEGYEKLWAEANVKNFSHLPYKAMSLDGHLLGAPQRISASADISSMVMLTQQADNDLKATTGFFDASLGAPGPEQSGKAILARQRQGDIGSFNYQDNLALAITTIGRYLVDLIPKVYDAPRIVRITGADDQQKTVMIHAGQPPPTMPEGVEGVYDVSAGTYDVTVSVGPSYQSRRQEAVAAMTEFVRAYPPSSPVVLPILAKAMDWPGAQEIAKGLTKMLPPELKEPEIGPDGQPIEPAPPPPEMVQQIEQMTAQIEQMGAELEQTKTLLSSKQLETQSAEKIAALDNETKWRIAEMQAQTGLAKLQTAITQKELETTDGIEIPVTKMETASRERIAKLNAAVELAKAEAKIDGATEQTVLKALSAESTARLKPTVGASRPTDTTRTEDYGA